MICIELGIGTSDNIFFLIKGFGKVVDFSSDETTGNAYAGEDVQFITSAGGPASGGGIFPEDRVLVKVAAAGIIDGVAVASEGAAADQNM